MNPPLGVLGKTHSNTGEWLDGTSSGSGMNGFGSGSGRFCRPHTTEQHPEYEKIGGLERGGGDMVGVVLIPQNLTTNQSAQVVDRHSESDGGFRFRVVAPLRPGCDWCHIECSLPTLE